MIANVEVGRQSASRAFWERCDDALAAHGALLDAHDRLQNAISRHRYQITTHQLAGGGGTGPDQLGLDSISESQRPRSQAVAPPRARLLASTSWTPESTEEMSAFLAGTESLAPDIVDRLVREWRTTASPQVVETTTGARVGARLADSVIERVRTLRQMDDVLGGRDTHDLVRQELADTLGLLRDAVYTQHTGRRILAAVGELCQLAGWVASDAGLYALAERYYLGGISAAHAADDVPLAGNLLSSLSYQVATIDDPRRAVLMATSAYGGARQRASGTVRALLLERLAWAHAMSGDLNATERTLAGVGGAYDDRTAGADPDWVYWLTRDEIDIMAGRCMTELQRPDKAIGPLQVVVDRYDETHARELVLYLSWLAEAYVQARDIDTAAATAVRALRLAEGVGSVRSTDRLHHLHDLLAPHRGNDLVDEFLARARESARADPSPDCSRRAVL